MDNLTNFVQIIGNVGKDPEDRMSAGGRRMVTFSLATNSSWKDKVSGEIKEHTEWHHIQFFNYSLDYIMQNIFKGSRVMVRGAIRSNKYTDKNGIERTSFCIMGSSILNLSEKKKDSSQIGNYSLMTEKEVPPQSQYLDPKMKEFDDIPF